MKRRSKRSFLPRMVVAASLFLGACAQPRSTPPPASSPARAPGSAMGEGGMSAAQPGPGPMGPSPTPPPDMGSSTEPSSNVSCPAGMHACGGECVDSASPEHCGVACDQPCPAPVGGTATCDGFKCGTACPQGQRDCQGTCQPEGEPCGGCPSGQNPCNGQCVEAASIQACGVACTTCPTDPNGTATCDGNRCGLECNTGFHRCGDRCVADDDPATCGLRCDPCPDNGGRATCVDGACDFECPDGRKCDGRCISANDPCGSSCANGFTFCSGRCVPNGEVPAEICDGKDNDCDGQVDEGNLTRECRSACGTGTERCDGRGGWAACTAPRPSAETCNGRDDDCDGQVDEDLTRSCRSPVRCLRLGDRGLSRVCRGVTPEFRKTT